MAFPVTLNGRTYTLTDFEGTNYVDGLPDAFEDFVTQAGQIYSTTSTTSNSIGTGSKTFTVEASKPYQVGTPLRIADTAAVSTNWIDGIVTAYSGTTLTVNAVAYAGSGTKTAWSINIGGGPIAYTGTLPIAQGGTGATTAAAAQTNLDVYSKADADSRFLNVSGEASDVTMTGNVTIGDGGSDLLTVNDAMRVSGTNPEIKIDVGSSAYHFLLTEEYSGDRAIAHLKSVAGTSFSGQFQFNANSSGGGFRELARMDYANGAIFNESGADLDFRVETDTVSHMLFVDAGAQHVNIATSTDLGGVFNVAGQMSLSGVGGGTRRIGLLAETDTYNGAFALQAGGGSSGYGGGIVMYGHSHATKAGDIGIGISASSNGSFRVNTHGTDTGTDVFEVKSSGDIQLYTNTLIQSNSSTGSVTIQGGATNGGGTILLRGGSGDSDIIFKSQASTATPREVARIGPSEMVVNEGSVDYDFRVEGDNFSHCLFVNADVDQVIIGDGASRSGSNNLEGLQTGKMFHTTQWQTGGGSRDIVFSATNNYFVEITYTTFGNYGSDGFGQARFIAGKRDASGFAHYNGVVDIMGTVANIAVATSDSGATRTYTLTFSHSGTGSNVSHIVEIKTIGSNVSFSNVL